MTLPWSWSSETKGQLVDENKAKEEICYGPYPLGDKGQPIVENKADLVMDQVDLD